MSKQLTIVAIILFLLSSCNEIDYTQYSYNFCNDEGVYFELYFDEEGYLSAYSYFNCDSTEPPGEMFYGFKKINGDSLIVYDPNFTNEEMRIKFLTDTDGQIIQKLYRGEDITIYQLKKMQHGKSVFPLNGISGDSLEMWNSQVFHPQFQQRLLERNCTCTKEYPIRYMEDIPTEIIPIINP